MFIIGNKERKQYLLRANGQPNLVNKIDKATQFQSIKSANNALTGLPKRWGMFCLEIIDLDAKPIEPEKKEEKSVHETVAEFIDNQSVPEIEERTKRMVERYQNCMDAIDSIIREIQLLNIESDNLSGRLKESLSELDKAKEAMNHKIEFANRDKKMNAVTGYRLAKELGDINCARRRIKDSKMLFDEAKRAFDANKYDNTQFTTFISGLKTRVENQVYTPKVLENMF